MTLKSPLVMLWTASVTNITMCHNGPMSEVTASRRVHVFHDVNNTIDTNLDRPMPDLFQLWVPRTWSAKRVHANEAPTPPKLRPNPVSRLGPSMARRKRNRRNLGPLVALALIVGLAVVVGRGDLFALLRPEAHPLALSARACLTALTEQGADFTALGDIRRDRGCAIANAVQVDRFAGVELNAPLLASCPLALATVRYLERVVQPAAADHLSRPVIALEHRGGFSCRSVRGLNGGPLSEHAYANAIDVFKFVLEDGLPVTVEHRWDGGNGTGAFLAEVGRRAGRHYSTVLGPDDDARHADHFHLGLGRPRRR